MDKEKVQQAWQWFKPYRPWTVVGLIVLVVVILLLIYVPKWQVPDSYWLSTMDRFNMENESRRTLAYIIGGVLVIIGVILTIWRIRTMEKQVRALEQQVLVAQEGQITERFTRAIGQLGSKRTEVRLGGIYALERIAKESEPDGDYWPIMEILTAHVRKRAPWKEPPPDSAKPQEGVKPDITIQAIITVLGRRKYYYGHGEIEGLDLRQTDLRGAYFTKKTHLERAILFGAHLENAMLLEAHLDEADLKLAHLEGAKLMGACLKGSLLDGAHLEGADLYGVEDLTKTQWLSAFRDDEYTSPPEYLRKKPAQKIGSGENEAE